jgi:hypothetical protein
MTYFFSPARWSLPDMLRGSRREYKRVSSLREDLSRTQAVCETGLSGGDERTIRMANRLRCNVGDGVKLLLGQTL